MCICSHKYVPYSPPAQRSPALRDKTMTPKKETTLRFRTTPEEANQLKKLAQAHAMSLSEYLRQAGLMQEIKSRTEIETTLELAKMNADQARLGNMLKLAIDNENEREIERLIAEVRQTQQTIRETLEAIKLR